MTSVFSGQTLVSQCDCSGLSLRDDHVLLEGHDMYSVTYCFKLPSICYVQIESFVKSKMASTTTANVLGSTDNFVYWIQLKTFLHSLQYVCIYTRIYNLLICIMCV